MHISLTKRAEQCMVYLPSYQLHKHNSTYGVQNKTCITNRDVSTKTITIMNYICKACPTLLSGNTAFWIRVGHGDMQEINVLKLFIFCVKHLTCFWINICIFIYIYNYIYGLVDYKFIYHMLAYFGCLATCMIHK